MGWKFLGVGFIMLLLSGFVVWRYDKTENKNYAFMSILFSTVGLFMSWMAIYTFVRR